MVCASGGKRVGRGGPPVRINLLGEISRGQRRSPAAPVKQRPIPATAVDVDRSKITAGDLVGNNVELFSPHSEFFGRIFDDVSGLAKALETKEWLSLRGGRINLLMHQVQLNLPQLKNETALFSFLAERIIEAGFRRVLFYNCIDGRTEDKLLAVTLEEAVLAGGKQVLLQRVDDPKSDQRCIIDPVKYDSPLIAVPLIANDSKPQGVMVIWNEQGETLGFDNHACSQFIILARMIGTRLGEIS